MIVEGGVRPRCIIVGVVTLCIGFCVASPGLSQAQDASSVDQIINSLTPGAGTAKGTRGIGPVVHVPPDSPGAPGSLHRHAASEPGGPLQDAAPASKSLHVEFASGSAVLTPAAIRTLGNLGRALSAKALSDYRFRIEGHTDTVGTPALNKVLAERRAQAVVDFVVSRYHVDATRLEAAGLGEEGLLVPTPQQTPEPRNRRVEVINLGS